MAKPNPGEFAKSVLWHLAGVRAEVYQTQLLVIELLALQTGQSAKNIQARWKKQTQQLRERLYHEALQSSNLEDPEEPRDSISRAKRD